VKEGHHDFFSFPSFPPFNFSLFSLDPLEQIMFRRIKACLSQHFFPPGGERGVVVLFFGVFGFPLFYDLFPLVQCVGDFPLACQEMGLWFSNLFFFFFFFFFFFIFLKWFISYLSTFRLLVQPPCYFSLSFLSS